MGKLHSAAVKKYAKVAASRLDMCVSTLFSPFAGVLYTVTAFEKSPEKRRTRERAPATRSREEALWASSACPPSCRWAPIRLSSAPPPDLVSWSSSRLLLALPLLAPHWRLITHPTSPSSRLPPLEANRLSVDPPLQSNTSLPQRFSCWRDDFCIAGSSRTWVCEPFQLCCPDSFRCLYHNIVWVWNVLPQLNIQLNIAVLYYNMKFANKTIELSLRLILYLSCMIYYNSLSFIVLTYTCCPTISIWKCNLKQSTSIYNIFTRWLIARPDDEQNIIIRISLLCTSSAGINQNNNKLVTCPPSLAGPQPVSGVM